MAITQSYVDFGAGNDTTGDGSVGNPWKTLQKALDSCVRNTTDGNQINLKTGTTHVNAAALDLTTFIAGGALGVNGPLIIRGYTATANDGGRAVIDCNGAGLWAATNYSSTRLIDLELHSFGNNHGIDQTGSLTMLRCMVHKGASSPSGKYLVNVNGDGNSQTVILGCHLYDPGSSGTCLFLQAGNAAVCGNYIAAGSGSRAIDSRASSSRLFAGNIITSATADALVFLLYNEWGGPVVVSNNVVYSSTTATGKGIYFLGTPFHAVCCNNIVVGFSGSGGMGVHVAGNASVIGHNAFYGCATNVTVDDQKFFDLTANDVALAANPFVDAANGDFSLTSAGKTALRGLGWPAAYLGAHANTDGHVTIGPVQYGEAEAGEAHLDSEVLDTAGTPGTYHAPDAAEVISTAVFGVNSGTSGTVVQASEGDVQAGVTYGPGSGLTGTFVVPTEAQVESGVTYGAAAEFTGTYAPAGLTAQQVRDAMLLAPTPGAAAAGSVDALLASILEDTGTTLPASFAGLASDADIADAIWDEARAGHATAGTYGATSEWAASAAPSAGSIADAVWDEARSGHVGAGSFGEGVLISGTKNTLDSLTDAPDVSGNVTAIKAVTDKLNTALELDGAVYRLTENALEEAPASTATVAISATQATQVAAGQVAIRCHHTFAQTIESTSQEDLTSGELLFAVKINADDDDDDAVVLLSKGEGLTVLAGAAYATAADGAITVNGSAGDWEITLQLTMAATSLLTEHAGAHLTSELKHCPSATEGNPIWTGTTAISKGVVKGA